MQRDEDLLMEKVTEEMRSFSHERQEHQMFMGELRLILGMDEQATESQAL